MSKNFGVNTSFTRHRKTAKAGYISSTQYGIVTGTHGIVITDTDRDPKTYALPRVGRAVYLHDFSIDDGCGEVSILDSHDQTPFGVLAMSHVYSPLGGYYRDGDTANVITFGCVYMVCSSNMDFDKIRFGNRVDIVSAWGSVINSDNETVNPANIIKTRWYFTGAVEFGVYDERFGLLNVAEVMVVPGSAVEQGGGDFVPKYGSYRLVGEKSWPGDMGHKYILPSHLAEGGKPAKFEGYIDLVPYLNSDNVDRKIEPEEIKSITIGNWSSISMNGMVITDSYSSDPGTGKDVDLADGKGRLNFNFDLKRTVVEPYETLFSGALLAVKVESLSGDIYEVILPFPVILQV